MCCSVKVAMRRFGSVLVSKKASSALDLYVVGTRDIALSYVVLSSVLAFGSLPYCIAFTFRYDIGTFVDVLLALTFGAVPFRTADSVRVSSTECLLCSTGTVVCTDPAFDSPHDILFVLDLE